MSDTWFSGLTAAPAEIRLFCFPHAGGGSRFYSRWRRHLAAQAEVCALVLPGHDNRLLDAPLRRMDDLVGALVEVLEPHLDRPFAFFGHSLGAAVAYETAQRLRQLDLPQPQCLFASGRRPPHSPVPPPFTHLLSDRELIAEVMRLGGLPAKALQRPRALTALLPGLRADYQIHDTYRPTTGLPLGLPVFAYAGDRDPIAQPVDVAGWESTTTGPFRLRIFAGDHFYLSDAPPDFVAAVLADLREASAVPGGRSR